MKIAFRFDSGADIGMGHLMRCLTLSKALQSQGAELFFLCQSQTHQALKHYLPDAKCLVVDDKLSEQQDAVQCAKLLEQAKIKPDWLIVDHYKFCKNWESLMGETSKKIMAIDDIGREHDCDLLLDNNFSFDGEKRYSGKVPAGCRLLIGPRYALLRAAFKEALAARKTSGEERIFVCFGGSDPQRATQFALESLSGILPETMAMDVVVGYSYSGKELLAKICARHPNWQLHSDHKHPETLMAKATIAVGAGGVMTWERLALGLPSIVISIADNQREACKMLAEKNFIHYLGSQGAVSAADLRSAVTSLLADKEKRKAMDSAGRALVDINGTDNVAKILLSDRL